MSKCFDSSKNTAKQPTATDCNCQPPTANRLPSPQLSIPEYRAFIDFMCPPSSPGRLAAHAGGSGSGAFPPDGTDPRCVFGTHCFVSLVCLVGSHPVLIANTITYACIRVQAVPAPHLWHLGRPRFRLEQRGRAQPAEARAEGEGGGCRPEFCVPAPPAPAPQPQPQPLPAPPKHEIQPTNFNPPPIDDRTFTSMESANPSRARAGRASPGYKLTTASPRVTPRVTRVTATSTSSCWMGGTNGRRCHARRAGSGVPPCSRGRGSTGGTPSGRGAWTCWWTAAWGAAGRAAGRTTSGGRGAPR
jgi:hypothetical protein